MMLFFRGFRLDAIQGFAYTALALQSKVLRRIPWRGGRVVKCNGL